MATIAISAGHNPYTGARAHDGTDEHTWNTLIVESLASKLRAMGHTVLILHRNKSLSYTSAMRKLGREMKASGVELALELHFNSASPSANGFEFLHWWGSSKGKKLAVSLGKAFGKDFPGISQRGSNSGSRSLWYHKWNEGKAYSGRGGAYCYLTPCPAVICEPGFASNRSDWSNLLHNADQVAQAYADGIEDYLAS